MSKLSIVRHFTNNIPENGNVYDLFEWKDDCKCYMKNHKTNEIICNMDNLEFPINYSQNAIDIIASKYFRRADVPGRGHEYSMKQVAHRMAQFWTDALLSENIITNDESNIFYDEIVFILLNQMAAPNSPQWFNTGLKYYGITGHEGNLYYYDTKLNKVVKSKDEYTRSQTFACYVLPVEDTLMGKNSLTENLTTNTLLFKYGSGVGSNWSNIRAKGESISGGGYSSGTLSFMKIAAKNAGGIKSGGLSRRSSILTRLDVDHPDIEEFIDWKVNEEQIGRVLANNGYDTSMEGPIYELLPGQNSNNSVGIADDFMNILVDKNRVDRNWHLYNRVDKKINKTITVDYLWDKICNSTWECGDVGVHFDDNINNWNTCANGITDLGPKRITASNACSEYLFLDSAACNLASLNVMKFYNKDTKEFDMESYVHTIKMITLVLEASIIWGQSPTEDVAYNTHMTRTIGLGLTDIGSLLMTMAIPYDSDEGRNMVALLFSTLTGVGYLQSANIASMSSPFEAYKRNESHMLNVILKHIDHNNSLISDIIESYDKYNNHCNNISKMALTCDNIWKSGYNIGKEHGYRNAQVSCSPPTGCLVPDTFISTDKGMSRLRNLGDVTGETWQDIDTKVLTDEGEKSATKFFINGLSDVVSLTTQRGYSIAGTPGHQIKVIDDNGNFTWRRLQDITESTIVPIMMDTMFGCTQTFSMIPHSGVMHSNCNDDVKFPECMNSDLGEFIGYFMGNGSLHKRQIRIGVYREDVDVIERVLFLAHKLFNLTGHLREAIGYIEVDFNSLPLVEWWKENGLMKHPPKDATKHTYIPHIPEAILATNNREIYSSFIRGLFTTDGTSNRAYVELSSGKKEFILDVQSMLLAMGYPTHFSVESSAGKLGEVSYEIRTLTSRYTHKFINEIGFSSNRKMNTIISALSKSTDVYTKSDQIPLTIDIINDIVPDNNKLRNRAIERFNKKKMVTRQFAERLLEHKYNDELARRMQYIYDNVSSTGILSGEMTYDLSVPENVTYIANGFISHNTVSFAMDAITTGIEPFYSHMAYKKTVGGGGIEIVNPYIKDALTTLGYHTDVIDDTMDYIKENKKIENAPGLLDIHLPIFDTAAINGDGSRYISPIGHVKMVAAITPFISMGISKTVNLPNDATVEDISDIYKEAWKLGVKSIAIYRDGSKFNQPLNTTKKDKKTKDNSINMNKISESVKDVQGMLDDAYKRMTKKLQKSNNNITSYASPSKDSSIDKNNKQHEPIRVKPKGIRNARVHEVKINDLKLYITTSYYDNGELAEIYVSSGRQGSLVKGLLDVISTMLSEMIQYGVPIKNLAKMLRGHKFEPNGFVSGHPYIKSVDSIVDCISKILEIECNNFTNCQVKPDDPINQLSDELVSCLKDPLIDEYPDSKIIYNSISNVENLYGELCSNCGSSRMMKNGTCKVCQDCGTTTGCS